MNKITKYLRGKVANTYDKVGHHFSADEYRNRDWYERYTMGENTLDYIIQIIMFRVIYFKRIYWDRKHSVLCDCKDFIEVLDNVGCLETEESIA